MHQVEWLKLIWKQKLTTPGTDKDVEQLELSYPVDGNENGKSTLEDSLSVSYWVTTLPSNLTQAK